MNRVFVVGSINLDIVIQVESLPRIGETIFGNKISYHQGGKGANQAVAIARSGGNVHMVGAVGNDADAVGLLSNLESAHINTSGVLTKQTTSGKAYILVDKTDNQIVVVPGANHAVTFDEIASYLKANATANDFLVTQFETPIEDVFKTITLAKELGLVTILNPSPYHQIPTDIVANIDYLVVNEHEARKIQEDHNASIEELTKNGTNLLITKGKNGASLYTKSATFHEEGHHIDVVDTTGAGDAFLGCFVSSLSKALSLQDALSYANAAGALATTKLGAQEAIPTFGDVLHFLLHEEKK